MCVPSLGLSSLTKISLGWSFGIHKIAVFDDRCFNPSFSIGDSISSWVTFEKQLEADVVAQEQR